MISKTYFTRVPTTYLSVHKKVEIAIEARSRISPDVCWRCDIQDIKRPNPLGGNNKMAGLKSNTPWLLLLRSEMSLFIKKHLLGF